MSWRADEAQPGVLADHELDDGVEQRLGVVGAGQVLLPDLGLGALLEHDQHAPVQRDAGGVGDRGQHDRRLDAHAARDVDERAAGPAGVVERGEDVLARRRRPCRGAPRTSSAWCSHASVSGSTSRPSSARRRSSTTRPSTWPRWMRALGRLEQRLDAVDRARVALAGRGGGERRQVELGEVRELPPGLPLNAASSSAARAPRCGAPSATRARGRRHLSQWSPPSGAR